MWDTRGEWVNLSGKKQDENFSVAILDHLDNVGYPSYRNTIDYGSYPANPLDQKQMSDKKEELNFSLSAGESVTFKHRIVVYSGNEKLGDDWIVKEFMN